VQLVCLSTEELRTVKTDLAAADKKTFPGKAEEEIKYHSKVGLAAVQCVSTENSIVNSGLEAGECHQTDVSDVTSALDISDSELLCQKKKKPNVLDALFNIDETATSDVPPLTATTLPSNPHPPGTTPVPPPPPDAAPEMDAISFLRLVRSFPLSEGQRNRPVVGPPSLDQEMLRRMEELHIPGSLAHEDVERVARLELLKQASCRVDSPQK